MSINNNRTRFLFLPVIPGVVALIAIAIFYFTGRTEGVAAPFVPLKDGEIRYAIAHNEYAEKEHIPVEYYGECLCGSERCMRLVKIKQPITRFWRDGKKEHYEKYLRSEWRSCKQIGLVITGK